MTGVPSDRRYARHHAWAKQVEAGNVRVGLTHVPSRFLGDVVYVELPAMGTEILAGEPIGLVESSSAVCEVVSPVSGTIVEANPAVETSPEKVSSDPYGDGWLLTIRSTPLREADALLSGEEYGSLVGEE